MIYNFDLGTHRLVRVWVDELPDAMFQPAAAVNFTFAGRGEQILGERSAAVECWMGVGPRDIYGLLGGTVRVADVSTVEIGLTTADGPDLANSLDPFAERIHKVRIGLPQEYAESVEQGIRESVFRYPRNGLLRLLCAAHCDVGSSPWIFRRLGRILTYVLASGADPEQTICERLLTT